MFRRSTKEGETNPSQWRTNYQKVILAYQVGPSEAVMIPAYGSKSREAERSLANSGYDGSLVEELKEGTQTKLRATEFEEAGKLPYPLAHRRYFDSRTLPVSRIVRL